MVGQATPLMRLRGEGGWPLRLREGVTDLLDTAAAAGIPVSVVSNALCGENFREFLTAAGLSDRFAAQIYSNEVGVRKPNPAIVHAAADGRAVADHEFESMVGVHRFLAGVTGS